MIFPFWIGLNFRFPVLNFRGGWWYAGRFTRFPVFVGWKTEGKNESNEIFVKIKIRFAQRNWRNRLCLTPGCYHLQPFALDPHFVWVTSYQKAHAHDNKTTKTTTFKYRQVTWKDSWYFKPWPFLVKQMPSSFVVSCYFSMTLQKMSALTITKPAGKHHRFEHLEVMLKRKKKGHASKTPGFLLKNLNPPQQRLTFD